MAEGNWRNEEKKSVDTRSNWQTRDHSAKRTRSIDTNSNWRIKDGFEERKYFSRSEPFKGTSRYQNNSRSLSISNNKFNVKADFKIDNNCNKLLNPKILNDLCDNESIEHITTFLISNVVAFRQTLASDISEELLIALLKLVAKACENSFVASKSFMLKSIMQNKFVSAVCLFLTRLIIDNNRDSKFWENLGKILDDLLVILENAIQFIPITAWEYLQTIVKTISLVLPVLQKDKKLTLSDCFEKRIADLEENIHKIKTKFEKTEPKIKHDTCNDTDEEIDPDVDFKFIDVYPNVKELTVPERPYIRRNIVTGQYTSLQQYLDIHFRLLREDFLNPIREDVCDYLNNIKKRFFNIKVHENVVFLERAIQRNIACFPVKLEISERLKDKIQTEENKRFMHGTLVLFSSDNFKSLFCGRVISSDELRNGFLLVDVPQYDKVDHTMKYLMIECVIFFEPYYQVLKVLQRLAYDKLPMEKYILKVHPNISYPKYMENVRSLKYPPGLNQSQIKALNAALNNEFVIVQGPPGTGKTYLGMTLVEMLLDQKEFWKYSGPMLVICYTNHALEQFFNGLSKFTDKLVRLGRNSQDLHNAKLKKRPMAQLQKLLKEKYNIYREEYCNEDYDEQMSMDYDNEFDKNFSLFVRYIKGHINQPSWYKNGPQYTISEFEAIRDLDVPIEIRNSFKENMELGDSFRNLKWFEERIDKVKNKLKFTLEWEKDVIFKFDFFCDHIKRLDYYFQELELFCWLLCDDGTVSFRQSTEVKISQESSDVEEEKVYNLLSNFVLRSKYQTYFREKDYKYFLSVSKLNQAAYELRSDLKSEKDLNQVDQRYLREQLDFLLNKIDYLKYCLQADFGPPEIEFNDFNNPFLIPSKHRWQLYKRWIEIFKNCTRRQIEDLLNDYKVYSDNYNDLQEMNNVKLLREMDIVGMTTTCAARLRPTLESLKNPIVVVEEAAEILESHIVAALTKHCQHLILLGDHQQLRPTTSDYTIEKKYNLGISLFERMGQNNVECHTLNVQHRMRPEISSLIQPLFYKELYNHRSVENYPMISGIDHPIYFVDHTEPEELYGDSSKMNMHEAKFLIELAVYLLNNNYKPEQITILAAYLGQSYCLKKEREKSLYPDLKKVRIAVVDNFQGEENDIILLSLVRSNNEKKVGFLSIDNRVCVALSRAKIGLFIIGNMTLLCEATEIWKSIRRTLESQNAIGRYLPLRCKNHKEHITLVSKPTEFSKVSQGGCNQPCNVLLECDHRCVNICHGYDSNHKLYNCKQPCPLLLCDNENHKCKKLCFEECGPCRYLVDHELSCGHKKTLPCFTNLGTYKCMELLEVTTDCGHVQTAPCSTDLTVFKCKELIETELKCGHKQMIPCYTNTFPEGEIIKCEIETENVIPKCGHTQIIPCFEDINTYKCQFKMEVTLKCGHKKEKLCYINKESVTCSAVCDKKLSCGHKCPQECHTHDDPCHVWYKCIEVCNRNLKDCNNPENHPKCSLKCYERCPQCKIKIIKSYATCSHFEKLACHEAIETRTCNRPCSKKLTCGHLCENKCSESCSSCNLPSFKTIPECGHKIKLKCTETPNQKNCTKPCTKILICDHKCIARCNETCACKVETLPQCGHEIFSKCGDQLSSDKCTIVCRKTLECGHNVEIPCNKNVQDVVCKESTRKTLLCGHSDLYICSESIVDAKCRNQCEKYLECGHKCKNFCYDSCTKVCVEKCTKKLECGHPCKNECNKPCTLPSNCHFPCEKLLNCGHKCWKKCYQQCTKICLKQCGKVLQCGHKCPNDCNSICVSVCKSKCNKKLKCGHECQKLCGQPCTQICQKYCQKSLECGHLCKKKCGDPCTPLSQCNNQCQKTLPCGHDCTNSCNEPCIECTKKCNKTLNCGHTCINKCDEKCACSMVKSTDCSHFIKVSCGETPTRLNCIYLCNKLLKCGHHCEMLCSKECICLQSCRQRLKCGCLCIKQTCSEPCECRNRCLVDETM